MENGGKIFCGTRDGKIIAWDWPTEAVAQDGYINLESGSHLEGHNHGVTALASSPGKYGSVMNEGKFVLF